MKGSHLGEFEELVLLSAIMLQEEAYIIKIQEELKVQAGRNVAMGALHATLARLEKKGFLTSGLGGATQQRGGRRKRIYEITSSGKQALTEVRKMRNHLWDQIPKYALELVRI